jgi:hypothetical protein
MMVFWNGAFYRAAAVGETSGLREMESIGFISHMMKAAFGRLERGLEKKMANSALPRRLDTFHKYHSLPNKRANDSTSCRFCHSLHPAYEPGFPHINLVQTSQVQTSNGR